MLNATTQYWAQVGSSTPFQPNYDNTYLAMVSAFVLITMDNWDANVKSLAHLTDNNALAFSFTILSQIIGVLIILNLFLAFLLAQLDDFDLSDKEMEASAPEAARSSHVVNVAPSSIDGNQADPLPQRLVEPSPFAPAQARVSSANPLLNPFGNLMNLGKSMIETAQTGLSTAFSTDEPISTRSLLRGKKSLSMFFADKIQDMNAKLHQEREVALSPDSLEGASLNVFGRKNLIRVALFKILNTYVFYNLMLIVIVASCVELCLDNDTIPSGSQMERAIYVMDIIFVVIFGLEAAMKIIVSGLFWNGPKSYLRNGW